MKVLAVVVSDLVTDARVRREAVTLAQAGWEVEVVGFAYGAPPTDPGVSYRIFPFPRRGRSRLRRLAGAAHFALRATRAVFATDADVIHVHNLHLAPGCLLRTVRPATRLVYDAHELARPRARTRGSRIAITAFERLVWRRADGIITTNRSRADYLRQLHGGDSPVVLGNYPADVTPSRPVDLHRAADLARGLRILLYQGGLYPDARCFDLVAQAVASMPGWAFVVVGFGSPDNVDMVRRQLAESGLANRGRVLPPVPLHELPAWTAGADAGVVPLRRGDLNNWLGDTNKLFEHLVAGVPVIGSDFPEIRRVIVDDPDGPLGAVFDPDHAESIAAALRDVDSDLTELSVRARRAGQARYRWAVEAPKLLALYERLADHDSETVDIDLRGEANSKSADQSSQQPNLARKHR